MSTLLETLAHEVRKSVQSKSATAREAKRLGLVYMGFGRYGDKEGNVKYLVDKDRLVPFKAHEKVLDAYNNEKVKKTEETKKKPSVVSDISVSKRIAVQDRAIDKQKSLEVEKEHNILLKSLNPKIYDENEMAAIQSYTQDENGDINNYLTAGFPEGTTAEQANMMYDTLTGIDNAFEKSEIPIPISVYTGLSDRYNFEDFDKDNEYVFKGYISSSLNYKEASENYSSEKKDVPKIVLQIDLDAGQKGIYVAPMSGDKDSKELLLPRGTVIKVQSGPHFIDGQSIQATKGPEKIALFHCIVAG